MGMTLDCVPVDALWMEWVSVKGFDCTEARRALWPLVPATESFCASGSRLIVVLDVPA